MKNSRRAIHLLIHTLLFLVIHILLFLFIHSGIERSELLEKLRASITEGKSGYYHSQSGVYIVTLWAVLYAIDICSFLFQSLARKIGKHPSQQQKTPRKAEIADVNKQRVSAYLAGPAATFPKETAPVRSGWLYLLFGGVLEITWAGLLKANMLGGHFY